MRCNVLVTEHLDGSTAIPAALDLVAPRLRSIRGQRGITLTELAERTGISKSTLSCLQNGQRRMHVRATSGRGR
jgi:DNA-binding XRE family transcriptional regulator